MTNSENGIRYPKVSDLSLKERFEAIPKATAKSTPEELRRICLDFMRLQLTFRWVPKEDFEYEIRSAKRPVKLSTDTIYAGLPYVNFGSGSLYRVMEKYDHDTGIFDFSEFKDDPQLLGNACTGAACMAWARVVSSAHMTYTSGMTQLYGYVNVGPYTYLKELPLFVKSGLSIKEDPKREKDYTAHNIGFENGREMMYECYACLLPADGVHSRGHVRMVSDVHVERDECGNVDGQKSYILYMDQVATPYGTEVIEKENGEKERIYHTDIYQEDGTPVYVQGGVDVKVDFETLFNKHYIPFTFKELIGEAKYQKPILRTNNILRTSFCADELKDIVLTANYPISDAFITVTTPEGKVLYRDVYRYRTHHKYTAPLKTILKLDELRQFENGTNSLEVQFQLFNGTLMKSYKGFKGTLCPCKAATELIEEDLNFLEKLEAIPKAKETMTPDELRKMCVDFMRLQLSFPHKLDRDLNYWVERQDHKVYLKKEEVHAGIPYVNVGSSSLYRWAECFDPKTGIVDLSQLGRNKRIFGNACSGGCSTSWARCISSARLGYTMEMTQANGVIPVGPYTYDKTVKAFTKEYSARTVCRENGPQTMYESYALVKPGDGLNNPGHIRMFTGESVVVRNPDGTIDGEKSYAICSDQVTYSVSWHHARVRENGHYVVQGGVDVKESFANLYENGYLPFTFKEFLGQMPYQKAIIRSNIRKTVFNVDELKEIELSCNYPMSDFFYTVTDPYGTVVLDGVYRTPVFSTYKIALSTILPLKEMARLEFIDGNYKVNVDIQLYNGYKKKGAYAFAGILTKGPSAKKVPAKALDLKAKLDRIMIAKPGMRDFRLRQICCDYMKLQCEFPYIFSEDFCYVVGSQRVPRRMPAGIVNGGLPYVTVGSGNLYRVLEGYDPETGVIDSTMDFVKNARLFGNACSGGAGISWSRVVTSANFAYTNTMNQANGFLNVGPYTYDKDVKVFRRNVYSTEHICKENGEQVMFESYAAMLPADGVGNNGHVRMNTAYPTVVRKKDGTIDGEKSYTLMSEQVCFATHPNHVRELSDGTHYFAQGFVDVKYTFKELLDTNYIPFTFAELIGEKDVEEAKLEVIGAKEAYCTDCLKDVTLQCNYAISDVFVSIKDKEGNEVYRTVHRANDFYIKKMSLSAILPLDEMKSIGGDTIEISCQLYNGEKLTCVSAPWKA
ncbi:MAG: hypothetical protein IKC69_06675 [Clostridia bacterium]|nr:hypothetical protein [Clostridia bacterium]